MIHEDIQYCLGMVLAGEGDLDRGVKEKGSVIFSSPLKGKHFDVKSSILCV